LSSTGQQVIPGGGSRCKAEISFFNRLDKRGLIDTVAIYMNVFKSQKLTESTNPSENQRKKAKAM